MAELRYNHGAAYAARWLPRRVRTVVATACPDLRERRIRMAGSRRFSREFPCAATDQGQRTRGRPYKKTAAAFGIAAELREETSKSHGAPEDHTA